jgi:hypothetical protein
MAVRRFRPRRRAGGPDAHADRPGQTAKLNNINPQAWLADVLARIADYPVLRLNELETSKNLAVLAGL